MEEKFYVEIVKFDNDEIVKRMGPMNSWRADRVDTGANQNLNHEHYFTRIVSAEDTE